MKTNFFLMITAIMIAFVSTAQTNDSTKIDFNGPALKVLKAEYSETKILLDSVESQIKRTSEDHAIRLLLKKDGYLDQLKLELERVYNYIQDTANHDRSIIEKNIDDVCRIQGKLNRIEEEVKNPENAPRKFYY
ncbi:MAG: hypothetical protein ABH951_02220 [Patescibacteria group bacterium]